MGCGAADSVDNGGGVGRRHASGTTTSGTPSTVKFPSSALKWSTKHMQLAVVPEAVRRVGPHVWWCYKQIFSFIWLLLLLTPMLVLYAVIWILMAAGVHMVNHPEASVSGGFNAAWSVPDYMKWAAGRMGKRFVNESSHRWR
jgi:hypothetical protein